MFPAIRLYESSKTNDNRINLLRQISEIEGEHKAAGDIIKKIRKAANQFTLPMDASSTFELTYKKLAEIERDTFQHMHIVKLFYLKTVKEFMEQEGNK